MEQSLEMSLYDDLVSVVIPVYNSEKFLTESIESVLNQTYKNFQFYSSNMLHIYEYILLFRKNYFNDYLL